MTVTVNRSSVTFAVHSVEPAGQRLPTCKTHEALEALVGTRPEACCDYTSDCGAGIRFHPLIGAAHQAWSDHRPLVLSPDMIWVMILQGLAQHVKNDPERFRDRFVSHAGRKLLEVRRQDVVPGSPENAWGEVIDEFAAQVRAELGPEHAWLTADFSTTGAHERAAAAIALLDAVQPYFELRTYIICGIPAVTLDGTVADWQRLAERVNHLTRYGLDWWLEHLRPLTQQFIRAAQGDVDLDHWRNIYKRLDAYGGDYANGWLLKLIPYLKNGMTGNFTRVNPLLQEPVAPYPPAPAVPQLNRSSDPFRLEEPAVSARQLPSGISAVPVTLESLLTGQRWALEFIGGFLGVTQDADTLALRPKLGWAVRRRSDLSQLLARVGEHRPNPALAAREFDARLGAILEQVESCTIPGDFIAFYKSFDGAAVFVNSTGTPLYRILPLTELRPVMPRWPADYVPTMLQANGTPIFDWVRFVDLPDGTFLAIDFNPEEAVPREPPPQKESWHSRQQREVFLVIHCRESESDPRQAYRVVSWSFAEFLTQALASNGRPFFTEPGFQDRGDAFSVPCWQVK